MAIIAIDNNLDGGIFDMIRLKIMQDLFFIAIVVVFFAACLAYLKACEKL